MPVAVNSRSMHPFGPERRGMVGSARITEADLTCIGPENSTGMVRRFFLPVAAAPFECSTDRSLCILIPPSSRARSLYHGHREGAHGPAAGSDVTRY